MTFLLVALGAFAVWILRECFGDMVKMEARARIPRFPFVILEVAMRLLPPEERRIRREETAAELEFIVKEAIEVPVTGLLLGIQYSCGWMRVALLIARPSIVGRVAQRLPVLRTLTCADKFTWFPILAIGSLLAGALGLLYLGVGLLSLSVDDSPTWGIALLTISALSFLVCGLGQLGVWTEWAPKSKATSRRS